MIFQTVVVGPFMENTYIVGSEDTKEGVVIDPGAESDKILEEINRLELDVKLVVNTHGHGDHTGAVQSIKEATGASYAIHEKDVVLIKGDNTFIASMVPDFQEPPDPDHFLEDGQTINFGDMTLQIIETPGHTQGSICLYGAGVVFTGDTLFHLGIGRFDLPGGDGTQLIHNIQTRLLTLPADTNVYPGHGPDTTIAREKLANPYLRQGNLPLL